MMFSSKLRNIGRPRCNPLLRLRQVILPLNLPRTLPPPVGDNLDSSLPVSDDDLDNDATENEASSSTALRAEIMFQMLKYEVDQHLESGLKLRSKSLVNTMLGRYSKFIEWFYESVDVGSGDNVDEVIDFQRLLKSLIMDKYHALSVYYRYLKDCVQLKSRTIYTYNEDMLILVEWFAIFRKNRSTMHTVAPNDLYPVNLVIKAMRRVYGKEAKLEACKSKNNTKEGLLAARKWPERGLAELNEAVIGQLHWARKVCQSPPSARHVTIYNKLLQISVASMYTGKQFY
jgi:hypothetical protein